MKKYIILVIGISFQLHSMENFLTQQYEVCEWDALAYDKGCKFQTEAFMHFFKQNNMSVKNKEIVDIGCGTCRIAEKLAKEAKHIHCADASSQMIIFAKENIKKDNISFEQCFAETFKAKKPYQLGIMSFCFHWFQNQKIALQNMYNNLEENGEFFATIHTSDTPEPTSLLAARDAIAFVNNTYQYFVGKNFVELSASEFPSDQALQTMLKDIGFTILKKEQQSIEMIVTEQFIRDTEWPIVSSRPIMKFIPEFFVNFFFNKYITSYLSLTPKTNDGKYLEKLTTTIIHARKVKK